MKKTDQCDMEKLGALDSSDKNGSCFLGTALDGGYRRPNRKEIR